MPTPLQTPSPTSASLRKSAKCSWVSKSIFTSRVSLSSSRSCGLRSEKFCHSQNLQARAIEHSTGPTEQGTRRFLRFSERTILALKATEGKVTLRNQETLRRRFGEIQRTNEAL